MEARADSSLRPAEIGDRLRAQFGDDIRSVEDQFGHAVVTVSPERYEELARFLRDEPDLALDYFDFTAGVDRGESGVEVLTHLASIRHGHHVRLRVMCDAAEPTCPTLSGVYAGANWHERETWELFGVVFQGHPHLVKLLLPEPFEGHPLRKDFELMSRVAKPWPGAPEGEEEEEE
ncbi:MAG: NADH-quinone oxidoreductase subunit C [Actinomycetota bacterium]